MKPFCTAIDWGTSSFRIWLFDRGGNVLKSASTDQGIMNCAPDGFSTIVESHMQALGAGLHVPVVVCGMAGSRQGWLEAPYLDTPARFADIVDQAVVVDNPARDVRILPGIAQRSSDRPDVMRGEETQLLGAFTSGEEVGGIGGDRKQLACIPGTHSKWIETDGDSVTDFQTFLTGELFSVIGEHTILRHAVNHDPVDHEQFCDAARTAIENPGAMASSLFSIRAGQLLGYNEQASGRSRLSGLLIGTEVGQVASSMPVRLPVNLIAGGEIRGLYQAALRIAGFEVTTIGSAEASCKGLWHAASRMFGTDHAARRLG